MTTPPINVQQNGLALIQPQAAAVVETTASAVAAREKAAVEARFIVALHRPRNPDQARARLLARCRSPHFAAMAEYAKPVGQGKSARGASIRMMEELARQWGNVDVQSQVVFDDADRRIVRVTATDLESNYSASVDVPLEKTVERRQPRQGEEVVSSRTNSQGNTTYRIRADEDAFLVKQNAAISKARRECIRNVVPGDLVEEALGTCGETRRSEVKTDPAGARKRIADAFYDLGVMPTQLCDYLGKPSLEAVTDAEVEVLRAIYTAMRDGETTWAQAMEQRAGTSKSSDAQSSTAARGTDALKQKVEQRTKPKPQTRDTSQLSEEELLALDEARAD